MTDGGAKGWFARQRERIEALWAQPQVRFGTLVGGLGLAAGLVISAGTTSVIRQTNTTEFCVSCHVYENFYEEFQQSEHFRNATGVQASCASCHLPHDNWASMIAAKAHSGFKDVWAYTLGGIDTPEDFEARRAVLARDIWEQYERNDSQFCRHCHEPEAWDLQAQSAMARGAHQSVVDGDATCIACHKGIAHSIPAGARNGGSADEEEAAASGTQDGEGTTEGSVREAEGDAVAAQRSADRPSRPDDSETRTSAAETRTENTEIADGQNDSQASDTGGERPDDPAVSPKQAAQIASSCRMCHGAAAPALGTFVSLSRADFLAALEQHMATGGTVESLTTAERRALYDHLRRP
ncbi:MAG: NapC/NirT family cytochrome c [Pseudomonadales bacterium]|jgi:nitrate/TMAO reductase-like tetraheme cytochrome c subunit|nr:NapC/NirT family cytochrome c [Pseudomonadales bacterium]